MIASGVSSARMSSCGQRVPPGVSVSTGGRRDTPPALATEWVWLALLGEQLDRLPEGWDAELSDEHPLATLVVEPGVRCNGSCAARWPTSSLLAVSPSTRSAARPPATRSSAGPRTRLLRTPAFRATAVRCVLTGA